MKIRASHTQEQIGIPTKWDWQEILPRPHECDPASLKFQRVHLPKMIRAFKMKDYRKFTFLNTVDTYKRAVRIYHVDCEGLDASASVAIRNENSEGVENWTIRNPHLHDLQAGDFADFQPRKYEADYGGFLADVFTVRHDTMISASFGTHAFADYKTASTLLAALTKSIFYVEIRLGQTIRHAFALHLV